MSVGSDVLERAEWAEPLQFQLSEAERRGFAGQWVAKHISGAPVVGHALTLAELQQRLEERSIPLESVAYEKIPAHVCQVPPRSNPIAH